MGTQTYVRDIASLRIDDAERGRRRVSSSRGGARLLRTRPRTGT